MPVPAHLLRHGDQETRPDLLDFAVNVFDGERPAWLAAALRDSLDEVRRYPDPDLARTHLSHLHDRPACELLPTAGATEAFTLVARARAWRHPVVVHPQFTEPHAALLRAGHTVTSVVAHPARGFALEPDRIPAAADLVVVGNPTNPTGVLHPMSAIRSLARPGRLVVVDEAFMDSVVDERESLAGTRQPGVVVVRSLTKHWAIPGVRAGYVVGDSDAVADLAAQQTPWSVSSTALAVMAAATTPVARVEAHDRAVTLARWRQVLETGLVRRGVPFVPSATSFVLARLGYGGASALSDQGIAVRRCGTFPGLDSSWSRIAVRPPPTTTYLLTALDQIRSTTDRPHRQDPR